MQTVTQKKTSSRRHAPASEPLRLETHAQAREYLKAHLTPVEFGPKGQPICALEDLQALNVIFPEDC